jgi:hypothetical protein
MLNPEADSIAVRLRCGIRRRALQVSLRRMQMVTEVGAENHSTIVIMIPSDFVTLSKTLSE